MANVRSPDKNALSKTWLGKYCDEIGLNFEIRFFPLNFHTIQNLYSVKCPNTEFFLVLIFPHSD